MPRPPAYPLDVDMDYTFAEREQIGQGIGPVGQAASGALHHPNGDLMSHVLFGAIRRTEQRTYTALAYLNLIDEYVFEQRERQKIGLQQLGELKQEQRQLSLQVQELAQKMDMLMNFFGAVIPDWQTQEEVLNGDDMGIVRPSAQELELNVSFETTQRQPGFAHEQVISITPPAGTFVKRGTQVTVLINLEG